MECCIFILCETIFQNEFMFIIMIFKIMQIHERNTLDNEMNDFNEYFNRMILIINIYAKYGLHMYNIIYV